MYPVAVLGNTPTTRGLLLASKKAGFENVTWFKSAPRSAQATPLEFPANPIAANTTRIINTLGGGEALLDLGHQPNRQQVRFANSGFLLTELPLGDFTKARYGAPMMNIENHHWTDLLALDDPPLDYPTLNDLETNHSLVADCGPQAQLEVTMSHTLWHAAMPLNVKQSHANITWLNQQQTAWQFSTRTATHILVAAPANQPPEEHQWHPMLREAIKQSQPVGMFNPFQILIREHWRAGKLVFLGEACSSPNPYLLEAAACGLEDAWVLSRMLENYEEDIDDGLQQYVRYRQPRARKIAAHGRSVAKRENLTQPHKRFLKHIKAAVSARFLPEIAMQNIDWFYGYDCIRGFR